eukprot:9475583-Pyramimonas_sp.AAC.1
MKIRGAGKEADADLFHFYDEWVRTPNEKGELDASFRPAMQEHFYRQKKNTRACSAPLSPTIIAMTITGRVRRPTNGCHPRSVTSCPKKEDRSTEKGSGGH